MSSHELEQPLWELIYELLSPEEEAALLQRITSDPEMARAYARVKLQSELVAAAARCDDTRGTLISPDDEAWDGAAADNAVMDVGLDSGAAGLAATDEPVLVARHSRSSTFRVANWIVAVAAMGLVVMSIVSLSQLRSPAPRAMTMADASPAVLARSNSLRTVVTTPGAWNEETTNFISVRTTSLQGVPAATPFELKLYDADGEVQLRESHRTDETGAAQVELAGALAARASRLEIAASDNASPPLETAARWVRSGHVTHLTTDLPLYQPGDTVSYRSLSLSRFDQRVDGEVEVEFDVLNEQGAAVPSARHVVTSRRGVGDGKFNIPLESSDGKLTILARSPDGAFPEQRREVQVRKIDVPTWHKELKLTRDSYEPGDAVQGRLSVMLQNGQPAVGKRLAIAAFVDQQPISLDATGGVTDDAGNYDVQFFLPQSFVNGDAVVTVNVEDDQVQEEFTKAIPIHTGRVDVQFYPEGGELVAGLRNRVYFQAWDVQGQAIHLEGRIVDEAGDDVARATTVHDGRGQFALTTRAGVAYRLIVDKPAAAQQEVPLPAVSPDAVVVLHTTAKVLAPQDTLDVTLRMRSPDRSLVLAAACRGGLVGLQAIEGSDFGDAADGTSECQRQLKLDPSANGVIRVTVYDSDRVPPAPIAERLVYRRPATRLQVQVDPIDSPPPGRYITLGLQTTDERGQPAAATLGVSVVNQALLNAAHDGAPNLETLVFLTSEIRNADELEDANLFLGTSDDAATAMDLLLGIQGWRRFEEFGFDQVVQNATESFFAKDAVAPEGQYFGDVTDSFGDPLVPVVLDNREAIETELAALPTTAPVVSRQWIRSRESLLQRWGTVLLVGGLLVLIAVVGLASARGLGRPRVWVPSVAMAGIAAVLGVFWIGSQVTPLGDVAYAPAVTSTKPASTAGSVSDAFDVAIGDDAEADSLRFQRGDTSESNLREELFRDSVRQLAEKRDSDPVDSDAIDSEPGSAAKLSELDDKRPESMSSRSGLGASSVGGGAGVANAAKQHPPTMTRAKGIAAEAAARSRFAAPAPTPVPRDATSASAAPMPGILAGTPEQATAAAARPQPAAAAEVDRTKQERANDKNWAQSQPLPARELLLDASKKKDATGRKYRRVYADASLRSIRGRDVPSTLLWQPLVITDAEGRATVSIQLPPTNATYVLRADAHGDGRIGSGKAMIEARQP